MIGSSLAHAAIIVRGRTQSILDMAGMLKAPKGEHVGVDDLNP